MPSFRAHQRVPPYPALQRVSPLMCHVSKLTNGLLPHPPLLSVSPHLQCATFLSSPTCSSLFLPSSESLLATCHVSELTNPLLPLSPFQQVSPHFAPCHVSQLTNPLLPLPPLQQLSPPSATSHLPIPT